MRVVRTAAVVLGAAALGAFLVALLAPRRRIPASPVPVYVAPPPSDDAAVAVVDAVPVKPPS
ncbi:MAG TPA: hypothetical protein VES93_00860 [Ornithinibacter sp.]|nr:hypothetical protein [Ornithinibacter sp.]